MNIWRPHQTVRVKALGLNWRDGSLLAAEIYDDSGRMKGVRPLGGTVEFGETAQDTVLREFHEELGIVVTVSGPPFFFENIYRHEGMLGHEVLILFDVTFPDDAFKDETRIRFQEDNGDICFAQWFDLNVLDLPDGPELYPAGLKSYLIKQS